MPFSPGTRIGNYEIQAPLGEGGMGAVYKAHDPTLQRTVAIKVLAKQDEDASSRLLQEARSASALNHPHICTIYDHAALTVDQFQLGQTEQITHVIDALGCALPGELVVLAQERGQLERLEVMVQQHLRRIGHVPAPGSRLM